MTISYARAGYGAAAWLTEPMDEYHAVSIAWDYAASEEDLDLGATETYEEYLASLDHLPL